MLTRDQVQRLLVHRAVGKDRLAVEPVVSPTEGVDRPVVGQRIALQTLLQQPGERALRAADRSVQQQDPVFRAVPFAALFRMLTR